MAFCRVLDTLGIMKYCHHKYSCISYPHSAENTCSRVCPCCLYSYMGLLPDAYYCGLPMHRECQERVPHHRGLTIPTCIVPRCMPGSLTRGFIWNRWWGKCSRHSRRMCKMQFYVPGKRPMVGLLFRDMARTLIFQTCKHPFKAFCIFQWFCCQIWYGVSDYSLRAYENACMASKRVLAHSDSTINNSWWHEAPFDSRLRQSMITHGNCHMIWYLSLT